MLFDACVCCYGVMSNHPPWRDYWLGRVDSRPLAVFRIFFGALVLKMAVQYVPLARPFFSDAGIVPRAARLTGPLRETPSLLYAFPSAWMAQAFLLLWAAAAFCLLVGYRTRLAAVLVFVGSLSVFERNLFVLNGADQVVQVLSFWAMFLPLGDTYAVDAVRRRWAAYRLSGRWEDLRVSAAPRRAFAFPVRLLQIQMGLIYLFTGLYKLRGGVWLDGTALHYVLQLPAFLQPTGAWFFSVAPAWLLAFLTHYTLWIELAFVLFMFLPWGQPALRLAGLILATALQVGIGGLMSIFNFQAVMVIGTFVFLEPDWIVAVERGLRWTRDVSFVPFWSGAPRWFFLVLAGTRADEVTQTADWPDGDVWVKDGGGGRNAGTAARQRLLGHLFLSRLWLWLVRFWPERNPSASVVALTPAAPTDTRPPAFFRSLPPWWTMARRGLLVVSLSLVMGSVLWVNLRGLLKPWVPPVTGLARTILLATELTQRWDMFATGGPRTWRWVAVTGQFADGATLDLQTGEPPLDAPPRWSRGTGLRWREFNANVAELQFPWMLQNWGDYLCRTYPAGMPAAPLRHVQFTLRSRHTFPPGGQPDPTITDEPLLLFSCADSS